MDEGSSRDGRKNEDMETERVGSKRGHVHRPMESKTKDIENGKRLKTEKDLTYRDASMAEAVMQPHRAQ